VKQYLFAIKNGFYIGEGEVGEKVHISCGLREIARSGIKKYTRAMQSLAYIQQGKVYLPSFAVQINGIDDVMSQIVEPFLMEHEQFSEEDNIQRKLHDDIVDNCLDAVSVVNRNKTDYSVEVVRV